MHVAARRRRNHLRKRAILEVMDTRCARCGAEMRCEPAGDCWCKELPHGPMPEATVTGCLCRVCLENDLRELGLLREASE